MRIFRIVHLAGFLVMSDLLFGCTGSPMIHYYTLSIEADSNLPSSTSSPTTLMIAVDPISLPEVVDRPQIVLRSGANQVALIDEHRWAESLKSEIPRIIAGNLSQLLMTEMVWSYPQHVKGPVDYRIIINIQRFESTQGSDAVIEALWIIQHPSTDRTAPPVSGRSTIQQPILGEGYAAIAAAHSRALADISREIANAIRRAMEQKKVEVPPPR